MVVVSIRGKKFVAGVEVSEADLDKLKLVEAKSTREADERDSS